MVIEAGGPASTVALNVTGVRPLVEAVMLIDPALVPVV